MTYSWGWPGRLGPLLLFGLLAAALVAVEYTLVHRIDMARYPALPLGVAGDLLVVLPGLFYVSVVRRYRLPVSTVAAAFGGGLVLGHWLLPETQLPLLAWAGRLAGVFEVITISYAAVRLRRIWRAYQARREQSTDFLENLHAAMQPVLGRLAEALATEIAVLRYAILGAWAPPEVDPGAVAFSVYHRSGSGPLLAVVGGLGLLEAAAVHLVVGHWYPRAAWLLTILSAYSLLWLLAHGQAVRCRPVLATSAGLVVRVGLVWRVFIPKAQLSKLEQVADAPPAAPDLLNAARLLFTPPNLLLTLAAPQVVRGPYGLRRTVRRLAIYVDEPAALAHHWA